MQQIVGGLYPATVLDGSGITLQVGPGTRSISVPTRSAITIFNKITLLENDMLKNELGLYTRVPIGSDKMARFGRIGPANHLLRARANNGCSWDPTGRIRMATDEVATCPVQYQGEICPDALWNQCLEGIFGPGNAVHDLMGTPAGQQLFNMLLVRIYQGLGTSLSSLYHYANHPDLTTINAASSYPATTTAEEWADYYTQQTQSGNCAGIVTLLDALGTQGYQQFAGEISEDDFDGTTYTGDIKALLDSLVNSASPILKSMSVNGFRDGNGRVMYPMILLSPALYQEYEDYLITTGLNANQSTTWNYLLTKQDGTMQPMPGTLKYKGMPVIRWDEIGTFDHITGAVSHRAVLAAPGAFGIAAEPEGLPQDMYSGLGLNVLQRLEPPFMGKIYMHTTFRWGAFVPDLDLIVQKKRVFLPS